MRGTMDKVDSDTFLKEQDVYFQRAAAHPWQTAARPASPHWPPTPPAGRQGPPRPCRRLPLSRAHHEKRKVHCVSMS